MSIAGSMMVAAMLHIASLSAVVAPLQASEQASAEILVTGVRLRATKVDYRLRGAALRYCGPRDPQQNPAAVSTICAFVEACALQGRRSHADMTRCVEGKIAAREARRR
ncbi:hypothetical protein [Sphingomonas sp. R1]|uniref:hypothetical protein n=1 Tax=Sphingomonas sp. R1 TaxID=399176 RepID=UPI00222410B6|nr:hypothetical protein [Sphingomonas sp. R1]UYY78466.1 hypothetical protein OIM94_05565 [Sphingomonas sp. R1]